MKPPKKKRAPIIPSASSIGSANELVVCADLLIRGLDVYKAVSPGAPYDLLASFDGIIFRVEVGTRNGSWGRTFEQKIRRRAVDVVAAVDTFSSRIVYTPDLHFFLVEATKARKAARAATQIKT